MVSAVASRYKAARAASRSYRASKAATSYRYKSGSNKNYRAVVETAKIETAKVAEGQDVKVGEVVKPKEVIYLSKPVETRVYPQKETGTSKTFVTTTPVPVMLASEGFAAKVRRESGAISNEATRSPLRHFEPKPAPGTPKPVPATYAVAGGLPMSRGFYEKYERELPELQKMPTRPTPRHFWGTSSLKYGEVNIIGQTRYTREEVKRDIVSMPIYIYPGGKEVSTGLTSTTYARGSYGALNPPQYSVDTTQPVFGKFIYDDLKPKKGLIGRANFYLQLNVQEPLEKWYNKTYVLSEYNKKNAPIAYAMDKTVKDILLFSTGKPVERPEVERTSYRKYIEFQSKANEMQRTGAAYTRFRTLTYLPLTGGVTDTFRLAGYNPKYLGYRAMSDYYGKAVPMGLGLEKEVRRQFREEMGTNLVIFGASAGTGFVIGGASAAIKGSLIAGKSAKALLWAGRAGKIAGLGLTGLYATKVGMDIYSAGSYEAKGAVIGKELVRLPIIYTGLKAGSYGYQYTAGIVRTRGLGYIKMKDITSKAVLEGKEQFPTANPKEHLKLFLQSQYHIIKAEVKVSSRYPNYGLPQTAPKRDIPKWLNKIFTGGEREVWESVPWYKLKFYKPLAMGYHTTTGTVFMVVQPGTSEIRGFYISGPVSPHFLGITGSSEKNFFKDFWTIKGHPNIYGVYPKGGFKVTKPVYVGAPARTWLQKLFGEPGLPKLDFPAGTATGTAHVPVLKYEHEAVIPVSSRFEKMFTRFYTTWKGIRVPITEMYALPAATTTVASGTKVTPKDNVRKILGLESKPSENVQTHVRPGGKVLVLTQTKGGEVVGKLMPKMFGEPSSLSGYYQPTTRIGYGLALSTLFGSSKKRGSSIARSTGRTFSSASVISRRNLFSYAPYSESLSSLSSGSSSKSSRGSRSSTSSISYPPSYPPSTPSRPPYSYLPPRKEPPGKPISLPLLRGFEQLKSKKSKAKLLKFKSKYTPTIEGGLFNIRGVKPTKLSVSSGLTLRPLLRG